MTLTFLCLIGHLYISLEKSLLIFSMFFLIGLLSFYCLVVSVLCIFWIFDLSQVYNLQLFSSVLWVAFLFSRWCIFIYKSFKFWCISVYLLCFGCAFGVVSKKHTVRFKVAKTSVISPKSVVVSALPCRSLIHFIKFLYIFWIYKMHPYAFGCIWMSSCPSTVCRDDFFPPWMVFVPLSEVSWP